MSFESDVNKFMLEVTEKHFENTVEIEEALYRQIAMGSPVDTGRYASNHRRSLGKPDTSVTSSTGMFSAPPKVPAKVKDLVFYISNNLPYARRIEDGWSQQAPDAPIAVYGLAYNDVKARFGL